MHAFSKTDHCKSIAALLENKGIKVPSVWSRLGRHFFNTKRRVRSPEDFEGPKMRVPGSKIYVSMWKNLKSNPTPMA
jgi:TRAP-type C4-dicarboxylate transport system substrate-binding protein